MNKSEIKKALKLLSDRIESSSVLAITGSKKQALSVKFVGGWEKVFYSFDQVQAWIDSH